MRGVLAVSLQEGRLYRRYWSYLHCRRRWRLA
jgi:hypothetical protein